MACRQRLPLSCHRRVQQFFGGHATELDAALTFLVVFVGSGQCRQSVSVHSHRAWALGRTFRSRVRDYHSSAVGAVFHDAVHDLRHHPHRRKQQKQLGRLASALLDCDRGSAKSRSPHTDELASKVVWYSTDPESPKKSSHQGGSNGSGTELKLRAANRA